MIFIVIIAVVLIIIGVAYVSYKIMSYDDSKYQSKIRQKQNELEREIKKREKDYEV